MRTLLQAIPVLVSTLLFACSEGDDPNLEESNGGSSGASGSGGTGAVGGDGGGGGSGGDAIDPRREACATLCATEAELECGQDEAACIEGWCDDPLEYFPHCLGPADTLLGCLAAKLVDAFECSDGRAFPKEEICVGEKSALEACIRG